MSKRFPLVVSVLSVFFLMLACSMGDGSPGQTAVTPATAESGLGQAQLLAETSTVASDQTAAGPSPTAGAGIDALPATPTVVPAGPAQGAVTPGALPTAMPVTGMGINLNLLSGLLDWNFFDSAGGGLGQIHSLVADRQSGQFLYVFLDAEDAMIARDGLIGVPWSAIQITPASPGSNASVAIGLDRQTLAAAPIILDDDNINFNNPAWDDSLVNYWQGKIAALPNTGANAQGSMVQVKEADDFELLTTQGEELGDIEDLILNLAEGRIIYLVLDAERLLNLRQVLIPIPFEKVRWDGITDDFVLNAQVRNALGGAPTIGLLDTLDPSTPGWDDPIRTFWSSQPGP